MGCLEEKDETQSQTGNLRARGDSRWTCAKMHLTSPPSSTGGNGRSTCCAGTGWRARRWGTHEGPFSKKMRTHCYCGSDTHTHTHMFCICRERRSWRTPGRRERRLSRDQLPDCGCSSARGSAGRKHTDWTEKTHRLKQGWSRPGRQGPRSSQVFCPTGQKTLSAAGSSLVYQVGQNSLQNWTPRRRLSVCVCVCLSFSIMEICWCALMSLSDLFDEESANYLHAKLSPLLIAFCLKVFLEKEESRELSSSCIYMHSVCAACRL